LALSRDPGQDAASRMPLSSYVFGGEREALKHSE